MNSAPKNTLNKVYNHSTIEDRWYEHWSAKNYFSANTGSDKQPYTIVIPPPNVTGMLTMGHVLNNTIQDILIRRARMQGKEACWIPGTDHASIATESKVVKLLKDQGIDKKDLTREEFLEHAWDWKTKYGGIIIKQLKKLGCSCDWERERFTMDNDYSRAVLTAFVKLYEKGLIYRGHRLVNWCPVSCSAISDEEVIHEEVNGHLWFFRYPIKNSENFLSVATTRPETMLGDTAVAVNPNDKRYKNHIGESIELPIVGREIPIIADDHVDPEFGTGCVKVTPAHDPNDFLIGERHKLEFINIMNENASMNDNVPSGYIGLSREKAREKVVEEMESLGLMDRIEDHIHKVGISERGQVPIEYYMSNQWFLKMKKLSKPALEAVKKSEINFHPKHWVKTYNHWLENIKDWCISRQLWWGHQIPVWYHKDNPEKIHVSVDGPEDLQNWQQDKDVLDTWASSWLWPMAVHTWPNDGKSLKKFYPTDTLVTGPDIIFFWVARMIITGYEFMDTPPFKDVYFTSILRDQTGKKFSKSLGNSPDPFELFEEFGTDAVRYGTMLMAPQGLDVLFSKDRLEVGRNFMNKLWNACRFIQLNTPPGWKNFSNFELPSLNLYDKWILSRLSNLIEEYNSQLDRFHFNEAAKILYEFTWNDFCDWYIEIAKMSFNSDDDTSTKTTLNISVFCIQNLLGLLHPYSPFITEELWAHFKNGNSSDLIVSKWPSRKPNLRNKKIEKDMSIVKEIITALRSIRSRMNIPKSKKSILIIKCQDNQKSFIDLHEDLIKKLSFVTEIQSGSDKKRPSQSCSAIVQGMELYLPLGGLVDLNQEIARMEKRKTEIERLITNVNKKLLNKNFIKKAPEHIINHEKSNLNKLTIEMEKVSSNLEIIK